MEEESIEVSEILKNEKGNDCCINLYLEENGWCAYEVSAYLLMNLLGGKCMVDTIEKCGTKLVRTFLNLDLLGSINYSGYYYTGMNSYNLQLVGTAKIDEESFFQWKSDL